MSEVKSSKRNHRFVDLTGKTFGRLTVISEAEKRNRYVRWLCRCRCGKETTVDAQRLTGGHTKSCGCFKMQRIMETKTIHGMFRSSEHAIWRGIKDRCLNPNSTFYEDYGGRGIIICDEWREDFMAFFTHVGQRPSPSHSIDRFPNVNGNYEPGNVRWATKTEQSRNRRNNRLLFLNGVGRLAIEWEPIVKISASTIKDRLSRGWSQEKALTVRPRKMKNNLAFAETTA